MPVLEQYFMTQNTRREIIWMVVMMMNQPDINQIQP